MRHQDSLIGVCLIAFCAFVFWLTTGFDEVPPMLSQNVPPTFFPRLVLAIIALLSVLLTLQGLKKDRDVNTMIEPAVYVTAAIIAATGVMLAYAGTFPTLFLVAIVLPIAWRERRWHLIGALAIGLPVAVYVIFTLALGVRFPSGRLFEGML
ncbi:MAG TPA: tripartite tricarboxylate transporter TctB family protein [Gammaproteobacteria bacterium]|nr:tripartite tricarboxylate transporter TctB family protein [Gammaproteobacteria bacterium]